MRRSGPPPKPTHIKLLADNPGKRPLNTKEPQPRSGVPRCPEWLSEEARSEWRWMVKELRSMGLLTLADRHALINYCQTWARWRAAEEFIAKHGETYPIRDNGGKIRCMQQFPQVAIARNLLLVLRAYQQEFGMTPAARSRIQVGSLEPESEKANRYWGEEKRPVPVR